MNPALLTVASGIIKNITELCKKVLDAGDPEKYSSSIEQLNSGVSDTYEEMRNIIVSSKSFTDEEKLVKLEELAKSESVAKERCAEAVKGNREHISKITLEIFKGLLTCGLSFAPAIIKSLNLSLANEKELLSLEDKKDIL